jgi:hypothetical protein
MDGTRFEHSGLLGRIVEGLRGPEDPEHPFLLIAEVEADAASEVLVPGEARVVELTQDRERAIHVPRGARRAELPQPLDQVAIETRPDVERALGIEHPPEGLGDDAGRRERDAMTRHHEAGVAVRGAGANVGLLEERDGAAAFGEIERGADTDHPATDHDDRVPLHSGRV